VARTLNELHKKITNEVDNTYNPYMMNDLVNSHYRAMNEHENQTFLL